MNKKWTNRKKKMGAGLLAASLCVSGLPQAAVFAEEGGAMGRYVEEEISLPENAVIQDIVRLDDGTLRIVGTVYGQEDSSDGGCKMWDSADDGATWEEAAALPEEYAEAYFASLTLARDGSGAGIMGDFDEASQDMTYALVSFDAEGNAQKSQLSDPAFACVLTENKVLAATGGGGTAFTLDLGTGEVVNSLAESNTRVLGACGKEVLLLGPNSLQRCDAETGEPLERDAALEEALFADGSTYEITSGSSYPIVFAQDEEARLFYCTHRGIYSHMMDEGVVEQVVNGDLSSLGDPSVGIVALEVKEGSFYLLYNGGTQGNKMLKFSYDADIPSVPQRELTIYSLTEDPAIRQAASQFQKKYPDTAVQYVTGMSGQDGVTTADALRTLNTDILAGNGPDVLMMDGMNIDTYAQKGLLMDLSDIVNQIRESDGLLDAIAGAYQNGDTLPAVGSKFYIPVIIGDPELLKTVEGVDSVNELAAQSDALPPFVIAALPEIMYPVCAGSWKKEDGTIDQEALSQYVESICQAYKAYWENASEYAQQWLERMSEYQDEMVAELSTASATSFPVGPIELLGGRGKVSMGSIGSMNDYSGIISVNRETGSCQMEPGRGQQTNVFIPTGIFGVSNTAKEQERAVDFIRYILSEDGQLNDLYSGFAVNRKAFERTLNEPQFQDGEYTVGQDDNETGEYTELSYSWPSEEECRKLADLVEQLTVCADCDRVQREVVLQEIRRCMDGEISAEEVVNSIMQKVNLYLAE